MCRVFISQPMNGRIEDEILAERSYVIGTAKRALGEDIEVLDSYFEDYQPSTGNVALKYLSKSLEILADADLAYFAPGWKEARGCAIEHICAEAYDIPCIEVAAK